MGMENQENFDKVPLDKEPSLEKIKEIRKSLIELTNLIPVLTGDRQNEILRKVNKMIRELDDLPGEISW